MGEDFIVKEFPELVKRYGRESVAKSVAVVLITEQGRSVEEVVEYTGLSYEYVKRLRDIHRILDRRIPGGPGY